MDAIVGGRKDRNRSKSETENRQIDRRQTSETEDACA